MYEGVWPFASVSIYNNDIDVCDPIRRLVVERFFNELFLDGNLELPFHLIKFQDDVFHFGFNLVVILFLEFLSWCLAAAIFLNYGQHF